MWFFSDSHHDHPATDVSSRHRKEADTMALVKFESPNPIIGCYLGAARVLEYRLTYTLFNYVLFPQSMLFFYLWATYNEAIARKDIARVRRAFRLNLTAGMTFSVVAV
jgi:hypothetical protein